MTKDEWSTNAYDWQKINIEDEVNQAIKPLGQGTIPAGTEANIGLTIQLNQPVRSLRLYLDSTGGGVSALYFMNAAGQTILLVDGYIGWHTYVFESDVTQVRFRNFVLTTEDIHISMYSDDSIPYIIKEKLPKLEEKIKVENVQTSSYNLINPSSILINKGLYSANIVDATDVSVSNYIPVRGQNIKANTFKAPSWDAFVVYDADLVPLREIKNSDTYTYQEGDAFVRIMLAGVSGTNLRANYGDTLNDYVAFNPIDGYLKDVKDRFDTDEGLIISINSETEEITVIENNAAINSDGDIVSASTGGASVRKIKVTPFEDFYIDHIRAAVLETSGTYYKYAWYSSYEVINAGTFISGASAPAPFDDTIENVTLTPPAGALAFVFSAYSSATIYKKQNTANSMKQLYFNRNVVEKSFNHSLGEIQNGNRKIFGTAFSFKDFGINPNSSGISPFENTMHLTGMGWCYFGPFNPNNDETIHIEFDVKELNTAGDDIAACVAKTSVGSGSQMRLLQKITDEGHYNVILDTTYYRVHEGYSNTFYIWLYKNDVQITNCVIENMMIYSVVEGGDYQTISGTTAKELFESTDENFGYLNEKVKKKDYLIAPNGNKYDYGVDNNGNLIAIPVIPSKAAFFSNSLLFGNYYFGMDATNIDNDLYAKVNAYIATLNPNYVANRYSAVPFETIDSLDNIDSVVAATVANLQGDEDLVVIIAGGNTSEAQAATIMPTSTMKLLAAIRTKCPNARICWSALWYADTLKMNNIRNACDRYGAIVANIEGLNAPENQSYVGSIIDYGQGNSLQNTLNDVSNLVENTPNNITVTFTYSGGTYTKTVDVNSYSLDGTTLTYTGRYGISTIGAGHPGNRGMKAIANKILYTMGICDDENAYDLNS